MNKDQFLESLNMSLKPLSLEERTDILRDFKEHFVLGYEEGRSDAEISKELGSPYKISKELLETYHIEKKDFKPTSDNPFRTIVAAIGIGLFNVIVVFGPLMGLMGILFGGWAVGISFIASPVLVLIGSLFYLDSFELFDLFISITLTGLGLFIVMGMFYLSRLFASLLLRYVKFNIDFIRGGDRRE